MKANYMVSYTWCLDASSPRHAAEEFVALVKSQLEDHGTLEEIETIDDVKGQVNLVDLRTGSIQEGAK